MKKIRTRGSGIKTKYKNTKTQEHKKYKKEKTQKMCEGVSVTYVLTG